MTNTLKITIQTAAIDFHDQSSTASKPSFNWYQYSLNSPIRLSLQDVLALDYKSLLLNIEGEARPFVVAGMVMDLLNNEAVLFVNNHGINEADAKIWRSDEEVAVRITADSKFSKDKYWALLEEPRYKESCIRAELRQIEAILHPEENNEEWDDSEEEEEIPARGERTGVLALKERAKRAYMHAPEDCSGMCEKVLKTCDDIKKQALVIDSEATKRSTKILKSLLADLTEALDDAGDNW